MRFATVSAFFALVASALAQDGSFDPIYTPAAYQEVPVGEPFQITWDATPLSAVNARISIQLIGGPAQALQVPLYNIASGISNSLRSYTWTPSPSEYGKNFYGLVITNLDTPGQFQYSNPFKVVGPKKGSSTTTTTAATTTAAATTAAATTAADSTTTELATTVATTTVRPTHDSESTESTTTISLTSSAVHISADSKPTHTIVEESSSVAVVPAPTFTPIHNINGTGPYQSAYPTTFATHSTTGGYAVPGATVSPVPAIGGAATKGFSLVLMGAGALFALAF